MRRLDDKVASMPRTVEAQLWWLSDKLESPGHGPPLIDLISMVWDIEAIFEQKAGKSKVL
eukprot:51846-Karenia_brevis.AAC.1